MTNINYKLNISFCICNIQIHFNNLTLIESLRKYMIAIRLSQLYNFMKMSNNINYLKTIQLEKIKY